MPSNMPFLPFLFYTRFFSCFCSDFITGEDCPLINPDYCILCWVEKNVFSLFPFHTYDVIPISFCVCNASKFAIFPASSRSHYCSLFLVFQICIFAAWDSFFAPRAVFLEKQHFTFTFSFFLRPMPLLWFVFFITGSSSIGTTDARGGQIWNGS